MMEVVKFDNRRRRTGSAAEYAVPPDTVHGRTDETEQTLGIDSQLDMPLPFEAYTLSPPATSSARAPLAVMCGFPALKMDTANQNYPSRATTTDW